MFLSEKRKGCRIKMSTLLRKRTTEEYIKRISTKPRNSRENIQAAINNFVKFVKEKHHSTPDKIAEELIITKKTIGEEEFEYALYELLQEWIEWNVSRKDGAYTIRTRFSIIRSFLYHLGVKTNPQDIKQLLKFPKKIKENRYALKREELENLIRVYSRNPKRMALYLACSSSGMRIGEALLVKKKDLDLSLERIMIEIRAEDTKTKTGRITFVSKECQGKIMMYLDKLGDEDYVFTNSKAEIKNKVRTEGLALDRARKALGYTEKYTSNGFAKITTHSFRAYFFTKATRKHDENYAHMMTGHGGYLMQYDRLSNKEKLDMYLEVEPDLVVFDQSKNKLEIEKLQKEKQDMDELRDEVKTLREAQARQDKQILESLRKEGKIPRI